MGTRMKNLLRRIRKSNDNRTEDVADLRTLFNRLMVEIINLAQLGAKEKAEAEVIYRIKEDIRLMHKRLDDWEKDNIHTPARKSRSFAYYHGMVESASSVAYEALMEAGRHAQEWEAEDPDVPVEKRFLYALWASMKRRSELLTPARKSDKNDILLNPKSFVKESDKQEELEKAFDAVTAKA